MNLTIEDLHRNCIMFGEWIRENYYTPTFDGRWTDIVEGKVKYTTEQLFQIYLDSTTQNQSS